jgi:uncharacterized SAM-dependent methyltransferase
MRRFSSGGLLIGVDAKKDRASLDAAYADALGVTAAFNLNALRHINRIIGSNFDLRQWRHVGYYNESAGRVEMHLESLANQDIHIGDRVRRFAKGDRIHSENSYKYAHTEFEVMLRQAGFPEVRMWTDSKQSFWVFFAR